MKTLKKLLLIIFIASSLGGNAQITLQSSVSASAIGACSYQWVYLKHSGYKYLLQHSDTLDVFNLNFSLYKRIFIPSGYLAANIYANYVSEGLFDTDTLHIDYMMSSGIGDSTVIFQDNGSKVYKFDSAVYNVPSVGIGQWYTTPILSTDSGTFLILASPNSSNSVIIYKIYKLPGSLPCIPGCTGGNTLTNMEYNPSSGSGYSSVYPNPAISYTNIYYTLPPGTKEGNVILYDLAGREIKQYAVTAQFDHLRLTTSDIKAGTYFYQLVADGNSVSSKKIVVVK